MEDVGLNYVHLVYFTAIRNILWPFFILCGHLVYFSSFGMFYQEKSGSLAPEGPDPLGSHLESAL
jgi:hypothetical protein